MGKIGCESKSVAFVALGNILKANKGGQGATREKERGRAKIIIKAFVILIKNMYILYQNNYRFCLKLIAIKESPKLQNPIVSYLLNIRQNRLLLLR